jgi:hypothetical protein
MMNIRQNFNHEGGVPIYLEDLIKLWTSLQRQIGAIVQAFGTHRNQNFTHNLQGTGLILDGLGEIVPPEVGNNLELWAGRIVTGKSEIVEVDSCSIEITDSNTIIYIEIEETAPVESDRVIEDTGATVNVLYEKKGVIKKTPDWNELDSEVDAIMLYMGTTRMVKTFKESISELLNQ